MFLAFVTLGIGRYVFKRWRLRHSVAQTALYHQQIFKQVKTVTMLLVIISALFYIVVEFVL